jgi:hypothetical protein
MADDSENYIFKNFTEILDLMGDGLEYLEIIFSTLYSIYKEWYVDTGFNHMQNS